MFAHSRRFRQGQLNLIVPILRLATVLGISARLREVTIGRLQQRVLISMAELASQGSIPIAIPVGLESPLEQS